ncbi:MAG: hypothetical protein HQ553_03220 [Chloroflexi bacterium]|nr:hypothetical protein [Chloroflexota bacterium]
MIKLKLVWDSTKSRIFTRETILLFQHKEQKQVDVPVEVIYASKNNLRDILTFQDERYIKVFERFLNQGDQGYFAYLEGQCVHRSWVRKGPSIIKLHPVLNTKLDQGEVFIHYCETAPMARGRNIFPFVLLRIVKDFPDQNRVLISVNSKNNSSIRGIVKAGFAVKYEYYLFNFMGFKTIRCR